MLKHEHQYSVIGIKHMYIHGWNVTYITSVKSGSYGARTISGADSVGHGEHVPPHLQMAGHGGHREYRRTANKTLTKPY